MQEMQDAEERTEREETFDRLRQATERARRENDLPDFLVEALLKVAGRPKAYPHGCLPLVRKLVELLPEYDTYAQTGYLGMGVNDADIRMLINRIESASVERDSGHRAD